LSGDPSLCEQFGTRSHRVQLERIHQNNLRGNLTRLLWHQFALPRLLPGDRRSGVNSGSGSVSSSKPPAPLFYSPVPEGMLRPVCPQIVTVHDLLPLKFPEVYPRVKYYFRWILPRLLRVSQTIVVSSENTRRDLQHYWPDLRTPSVVLPIPYRTDLFYPSSWSSPHYPHNSPGSDSSVKSAQTRPNPLQRANLTPIAALTPYLLCVGETRPYKNIRRAIEAFARVIATGDRANLTLAIVGTLNRLDTDIVDLPQQLGIADRVQFLGRVSDEELADLYRGAAAFLFPSLYEGFGLPPLEAMACGCPTIVARASSLPEVCGTATHYVDPLSVEDIAAGIVQVTGDRDYADRLRRAGLEQVKQFQPGQFRQRLRAIVGI
jgi:glycosyltransferase involved in cell wall biosynthesis